MAFPVPGGVSVRLLWTLLGNIEAINVLNFTQTPVSAITQARADAIGTAIKGLVSTSGLAAQLSPSVTLLTVASRDLASNTNVEFPDAATAAVPGTATGDLLPRQVCLVTSLHTGLRGRSFRGRFYGWGFTESANQANGTALGALVTAQNAFIDGIRTGLVGSPTNITLGVLSRFTTPPGSTTPTERPTPIVTPVTSVTTNTIWDTQRRRLIPGV